MATNNADNFSNPIGIANGGTGVARLTAYAPLIGGTTSTGSLQQATTGLSSTGYALTSNGTTAEWQPLPTFILLHTLMASSSASLTFTSTYLTSAYTSYFIKFCNIVNSTGTGSPIFVMNFSTNNGSSYLTTNYASGYVANGYNSVPSVASGITTQCPLTIAITSSPVGYNGEIYINLPQSDMASYVGRGFINTPTPPEFLTLYGVNTGTTFINNIQFEYTAGLITTGTISLYGISQ
jgi:hypothetical protein